MWRRHGSVVGAVSSPLAAGAERYRAGRSLGRLDHPLVCEALIGREREIEALEGVVEGLPERGGLLVLAGVAGVGKTRLAHQVAGLARRRELVVLAGRCVPSVSPVPFRPLTEAFLGAFRGGVPREAPDLAGFGDHVGRLVPAWRTGESGAGDESPLLVGEAAVRLLRVAGRGRPGVVLVIEDLHWADAETLAVVEFLADALREEPMLCVCTSRLEHPSLDLLVRLRRRHDVRLLELDPLDRAGVERAVASCLGVVDAPAEVVASIAANSEGNPFLVEELLAGLVASGSLYREDGHWVTAGPLLPSIPLDLADSVRQRLAGFDAVSRRVLGAAALLGRRFDWELLPGIAEADGRAAADALRIAVDEQLMEVDGDGFVFRHALTREAVLADLLPPDRRRLAERAWPVIERANPGLPGPILELAADLAQAAGDPVAAATRLLESARRALLSGAFASAEATARRAQQLAATDRAVALDADEVLVQVLVAAGKTSDAISLGRDLAVRLGRDSAAPERQADLLVGLARAALAAGDLAAGQAAADEARSAAKTDPDPAVEARIDAVIAEVTLDRGDLVAAEELSRRAIAAARETGQSSVECESLVILGRVLRVRDAGAALRAFQDAAEVASTAGLPRWHLRAQQELALESWKVSGAQAIEETRSLAARYGAHITVAVMDLSLADIALSQFDRSLALRHASACAQASTRYGLATESVAQLWLAGAHALAGDDPAMQAAIDAALAKDPDDPRILGDLYGRVLASRAFVQDELDALGPLHDQMMKHVRRAPVHTSVFPGRVQWVLLHTIEDDDLGAAARAEFAETTAALDFPWFTHAVDLADGIALGRQGEASAAGTLVSHAYEALTARPLNLGMVHATSLLIARAALRDGWGAPASWLRASEAFFTDGGYDRLARRCRAMLVEAGASVPRRRGHTAVPVRLRALGVTGREVDVLRLVIVGYSNREIATELVLSPKTVERHLSSLFTRLGVSNRRDLAKVGAPHL